MISLMDKQLEMTWKPNIYRDIWVLPTHLVSKVCAAAFAALAACCMCWGVAMPLSKVIGVDTYTPGN